MIFRLTEAPLKPSPARYQAPAMTKLKAPRKWKDVETESQLCVRGGYLSHTAVVKTKDLFLGVDGVVSFIHVSKTESWLLEAATGKIERHALKRAKVFDFLRDKISDGQRKNGEDDAKPAEGEGEAEAAVAADDPMSQLDAIPQGNRRKSDALSVPKGRVRSKRGKDAPRHLDMPAREHNKHPQSTARRSVMVLPTSTSSIWLRKEDLPWLLEYLRDEVGPDGSQGVAQIDDADDEEVPNCAAAGVYMEWDFAGGVIAKWVQGPLKGKTVRSTLSAFTEEKWKKMDAVHFYGVAYAQAGPRQIKQAAWHLVEAHCVEANESAQQSQ